MYHLYAMAIFAMQVTGGVTLQIFHFPYAFVL